MDTSTLPIRFSTIHQLQQARDNCQDPFEAGAFDTAIDLALSEKRQVVNGPYLFRNTQRNARNSLARRRRREVSLESIQLRDSLNGQGNGTELSGVIPNTPEELLEAKYLEMAMFRALAKEGQDVQRVLSGLLQGETLSETAQALQTTPKRVEHLRSKVRAHLKGVVRGWNNGG